MLSKKRFNFKADIKVEDIFLIEVISNEVKRPGGKLKISASGRIFSGAGNGPPIGKLAYKRDC